MRSCNKPPAGLTLIEVVAGLALMATVLVSMLELKTRFARQTTLADRRLHAVTSADRLLDRWWATPAKIPVAASGVVPDDPALTWRTRLVPNPDVADRLNSNVVRLEILAGDTPVTAVDVLLPIGPPRAR